MANAGRVEGARASGSGVALPEWLRQAGRTQGVAGALVLLLVFDAIFTPNFLTWASIRVNLIQISTITIVGVGMTLVIATGGIDLSVGALMAISGGIAARILGSHLGPLEHAWIAILVAIVVPIVATGVLGLFN